ncbi:site-specific integrase [Desulfovibrionales bacterium]
MPKIQFKSQFVANPPRPKDKPKVDYFDTTLPGFLLEVRKTGTATYYLRYRDKNGSIRQIKLGTPETVSLEEARSLAKSLKSQAIIGFDPRAMQDKAKATPMFRDFVTNHYLPFVQTYKRSWEQDKTVIDQKMMRLWGHKKMNEFSTQDLIAFQNSLVQGKLKPGTVNRYMALVKYIFNLAERWEIIDKAPTRNTPPLHDANRKERFLTPEELHNLAQALDLCTRPVIPDILRFLLLTGARRGEVLGLVWSELDMVNAFWTLPMERNKSKKTKTIPLSSDAMSLLRKYAGNGSEYVFPNPETGKPFRHFFKIWERIRKEAGLPDMRIHDLRHVHASILINSGRSLYEVQKLLGHTQISTTQRYAHLTQDTLREAAEKVGQVVGLVKVENKSEPLKM